MLSYGRVAGRLSRITRHAQPKNFSEPIKPVGFINIGCLRYSSKSKKTRVTGTTAKVEECAAPKSFKKVPPMPPLPPQPPAPHATGPPIESLKPPERRAPCDDENYSCPASCTPAQKEACFQPSGPGDKGPEFKYWKHLIAAVILAGVSAYAYLEWFTGTDDSKKQKKTTKEVKRREIVPNPNDSGSIPSEIPYLLIGGGTAAFSAFRAIKAGDPTAKVLVITGEGDLPYMRPPLSKELWYNRDDSSNPKLMFKQWNGSKRSLFYEPPEFYSQVSNLSASEKGGVAVATGWKVAKIDVPTKTAYLEDGYQIKYEKCLIATGASPKNLSVFESADEKVKEKVIAFRTKEDYVELVHNIKKPDVKNIVIIGGGFLGSELASSLARNRSFDDQRVYQIFKEKFVLAQVLPEYLSEWTTKHTESDGVNCVPNIEVHDCKMDNGRLTLTLTDGNTLKADQVIVAVGVDANTQLAKESNLEVDPEQGGFLVNAELEARSNLWVAGDAACFYDVKLGRRRIEHHDNAVISGRLAGENMTGAGKPYLHQSMFWSDLGPEVGFEAIGIIDSSLETVGVFAKVSENDTPKSSVTLSDENVRLSNNEENKSTETKSEAVSQNSSAEKKVEHTTVDSKTKNSEAESQTKPDDFGKGVIFYVRNDVVVGILLWNIFNRMAVARQLLARGTTYDEINEAAKLFAIHED